ncbi:MAG: hypothetical protein M3441_26545 [Chloroflexota bacterium]|nr:hypothetical protein [Chloroflexota bacterium]
MSDTEIEAITLRARQFRAALEACDRSLLPISFQEFPRGSCGDAALLLGRYLQDCGLGPFNYVCGSIREEGGRDFHSHAWLQRGDIIVDITADQFDEISEPVIVTRDHSWHDRFDGKVRNIADYKIYDANTKSVLSAVYRNVVTHISDL